MGYNISQFRGVNVAEDFICTICTGVFKDPVQGTCEHAFCHHCITNWLLQNNSCPIDRKFLSFPELKPVPRYFKNIIEKLVISCKYTRYGCKFEVPLENESELENHQDSNCDFH